LLINAQHQCAIRRIEIQADKVADFFDEQAGLGRV
jgi:hypothetical protein